MRRLLATLVIGAGTVGSVGCAGNAAFVQRHPDGSGVIALKAGGTVEDVQKLAAKEYGPNYEIVGSVQPSLQQTAGGFDPTKAKTDPNVMHYQVRKKTTADLTGFPPAPGGAMAGTGMPAPGGVGPAGYQQPAGTSGFGTTGGMQPPDVFPRTQ